MVDYQCNFSFRRRYLRMDCQDEILFVEMGDTVEISFEGKLENGHIFYKNNGEHSEIIIGKNQVFPSLEKELIGMKIGETKTIELDPIQAFGQHIDDLLMSISKDRINPDVEISLGNVLTIDISDGKKLKGMIVDDSDDTLVVDFNHPYAGKKVSITCTIRSIEKQNKKNRDDTQ